MAFMRPKNFVVVDGRSLYDFGVYVSGDATFGAPSRDYSVVQIPGKSGDLYYDNGRFQNRPLSYSGWIDKKVSTNLEALRNFLLSKPGYRRIEDSYHKDEFYLGFYVGPFDPGVIMLGNSDYGGDEAGAFTLEFNCKPQRFLKSGENPITITQNEVLKNSTLMTSSPLIRVYGHGVFRIGETVVTIAEHSYPYIDIDCDVYDCFYKTNNANSLVTFNNENVFPVLTPGNNSIGLGSGISKLVIVPRWWIL